MRKEKHSMSNRMMKSDWTLGQSETPAFIQWFYLCDKKILELK